MAISDKLISQFAKVVKPKTSKKETTVYGTIVQQGLAKYVKLDGSEFLTPISTTVDALDGERVTVLLKNHTAIVTGNISSPAARTGTVVNLENQLSNSRLVNLIYPIGSIYLSANAVSPETLFGGKWEQIKDRFLLASGSVYQNGSSGGSSAHTHGLSNAYAKIGIRTDGSIAVNDKNVEWTAERRTSASTSPLTNQYEETVATELGGNTDSGSNMPPYLTVNVWKRIE